MVTEYRRPINLKLRMEDNVLIDESEYFITEIFTIPIPAMVLNLEDIFKDIFPEIYIRDGLYLPESKLPILEFNMPYKTNTGETVVINSLEDLEDAFTKYSFITVSNKTILSKEAFLSIRNLLSDRVTYPVVLSGIIDFIIGNFQVEENPESNLIFEDFMGISNNIKLLPPYIEQYYSVYDYILGLGIVNQDYLNLIMERVKYLEDVIYSKLREDILSTYRAKVKNSFIYIEKLPSPSSRRYFLNMEKQKQGV